MNNKTDKIGTNLDNKYYCYHIQNSTVQKYTFEISSSSDEFIFIDNRKETNSTIIDFLNLNLNLTSLDSYPSYPLIFKIDSPDKLIVKFDFNKGDFYNSKYMLEYSTSFDGNKCEYKGINTTDIFEKGIKYKIKNNCDSSDDYKFTSFSWIGAYEMQYSNFNFYQVSSNQKINIFF